MKPILVTGSHRSGSTWCGKMISLADEVGYIHEPFSLVRRAGLCDVQFDNWFTYICDENKNNYYKALEKCLSFDYNIKKDFENLSSIKDLYYSIREYFKFKSSWILKKTPLLKDPIALFSAEWLANQFNMEVVIIIRHPAAFAGSLKKVNWLHPFEHFLRQPLLIRRIPEDYVRLIEKYSNSDAGIIDQSILLWNIIHHQILEYRELYPNWNFVRHEDLSNDPVKEFRNLYEKLNINFSKKIKKKINSFSNSKSQGVISRNSKANILSWKHRLTDKEINKIKKDTHQIAQHFYTADEW